MSVNKHDFCCIVKLPVCTNKSGKVDGNDVMWKMYQSSPRCSFIMDFISGINGVVHGVKH